MEQQLQQHSWFTTLASEHRKLIIATTQCARFTADSFIARRGELSEYWIGVHQGLIKLAVYNIDGRSSTLSGVPEGGWCGEGSVIKREARRYDVIAIRASKILLVPSDTFHRLMAESLPFNSFVIRQLNERMGQFIATVQNERLLDVNARVAQAIAQLFHPMLYPRTSLVLELSQEEIGLLTGLSRQRVNRAMRHLAELELVEISYQSIRVINLDGLLAFGMTGL